MPPNLLFFGPKHLGLKCLVEGGINGEKVVQAACGFLHSCVITETLNVYVILSKLVSKEISQPLKLRTGGNAITKVICGEEKTFVVTQSDSCLSYGCRSDETCLLEEDGVADVAVGHGRILLLTTDGNLKQISPSCLRPEPLILPWHVLQVASGKEHVLLLTDSSLVLTFGVGSRGQLGHADLKNRSSPMPVEALEGLKIVSVSAGGWHSAALSDCGDLYLWGWNDACQLGVPRDAEGCRALPSVLTLTEPDRPEMDSELVEFKQVSCGTRHTVAIDSQGRVFGWGWNSHGQLGSHPGPEFVSAPMLLSTDYPATHVSCHAWSTILTLNTPQSK